jgi:hypothetical protein
MSSVNAVALWKSVITCDNGVVSTARLWFWTEGSCKKAMFNGLDRIGCSLLLSGAGP